MGATFGWPPSGPFLRSDTFACMGKHIHKLSQKNFDTLTAVCAECGPVAIKVYGNTYRCEVAYSRYVKQLANNRKGTPYHYKTNTCSKCGFVAVDIMQMDLDHVDGDSSNHDPENLQTLCANCHRLKSYREEAFNEWNP